MSSLSCSSHIRNSQKKVINRDSFVKLEKTLEVIFCVEDNKCGKLASFGSTASGAVIKNRFDGSYILTAAHVCDSEKMKAFVQSYFAPVLDGQGSGVSLKYGILFNARTINDKRHPVKIVAQDPENDICLLWVADCHKQALAISPKSPEPGDRAYNIAAPLGIFAKNMIPLQEGLYDGEHKNRAFYSIPAIGGSSGSPILNHKGELIGMIHSTYTNFNHLSISPTYSDLMSFIDGEMNKHISLHMIDTYMRILTKHRKEL